MKKYFVVLLGLIFLLSIGCVLILGLGGCRGLDNPLEKNKIIDDKPHPGTDMYITLNRYPALNDTVTVNWSFVVRKLWTRLPDSTALDTADAIAKLFLKDFVPGDISKFTFISGDTIWVGKVKEGDSLSFTARIKAKELGDAWITSSISCTYTYIYMDSLYTSRASGGYSGICINIESNKGCKCRDVMGLGHCP